MASGKKNYFLYLIGARTISQRRAFHYAKIGHSCNVAQRFSAIEAATPLKLKLLGTIEHESKAHILSLENKFKKLYHGYNVKREWFYFEQELVDTFEGFRNE